PWTPPQPPSIKNFFSNRVPARMSIVQSEAALLREALDKLIAGRDGALAAFASDGRLIHANAPALAQLGGATALSTFGLEMLAATVLETGAARGTGNLNGSPVEIGAERVDIGRDQVILVNLTQPGETPRPELAPPRPSAPPAPP